jgi:perosamine synthetase
MNKFIPVNEPILNGNEKKYLIECIDTGWISSEGPFVKKFEEEFAKKMGRKHAIAVVNGTAAIDVAVEVLGIGPGDEVILPSFTIISCVLQIVRSGATPVLVDCDPITWNMNVSEIEAKITTKTKAIMAVHIYGLPVDLNPVLEICKKYGLKLIEDSAEMIGQTYYNKPCGSFGDISTFSFYPNKHITTGEGGMCLTDDDEIAEQCRDLRNLCFKPNKRFVHDKLGWNLRMTNLQAAIGLAQLERLDEFIEKKRKIGRQYYDKLKNIDGLQLPLKKTDYSDNIYWVFGLVIDEKYGTAEEMMERLAELGIGTRPFFFPLNSQPILQKLGFFNDLKCNVSERIYRQGFYLPSGLALTENQIEEVTSKLKTILDK